MRRRTSVRARRRCLSERVLVAVPGGGQSPIALRSGGWRELLGRGNIGVATVLSSGVALYATNEFLTTSLMPTAIADIGGERFYAWVAAVYLVASVVSATTVGAAVVRIGPRSAYLIGFGTFAAASLCCALAPRMDLFLIGRTVQGLAGGLLTGLAYAVINVALPERLWTHASALVSAMWGVGTLIGPAAGGVLSHMGLWRWAFHILAILSVGVAVLVAVAMPRRQPSVGGANLPGIPWWSLVILALAVLAITLASLPEDSRETTALLTMAAGLIAVFVLIDRRARVAVLPLSVFRRGRLKWIYVALGVLMGATMVDVYVPLFGQRVAGLTPVAAGFLGAALAIGWTVTEIFSASIRRQRCIAAAVCAAPLVMVAGLLFSAVTVPLNNSFGDVARWCIALTLTGAGVGLAWPHLSAWAMSAVKDPAEGPVAAAAVNIVQLICGAFGAGVAGVAVNAQGDVDGASARGLLVTFAILATVGIVSCWRSVDSGRSLGV